MNYFNIIDGLAKAPCDGALYLIKEMTKHSGFFASDGKLLYIVQETNNNKSENIDTEYLSLKLHIYIHAVQNNPAFIDGYYDVIELRNNSDDYNIDSFIKLCYSHSQNIEELNFRDFFYSLISLFQLPKEQQFKNALGLFGELKLIEYFWTQYSIDISGYWHKSGSFSKFDFAFSNFAFEAKTILSESLIVPIKHNQLFTSEKVYLCVLNCENSDIGETIEQLIKRLLDTPQCCCSFNFTLNLEKELKRITITDLNETKFNLLTMNMFKASDLNPFGSIPDEISKLTYNYDLVGKDALSNKNIKEIIKNV